MVGNGGFSFQPAELKNVQTGDIITFEFYPLDHSVARAEFGSACAPYEYTGPEKAGKGFWSGTKWLSDPMKPMYWNLTVPSTEPIFFYCAAPGSCKTHQMVGVINPNETQTLARQILAARNADFEVEPGGKIPSEGTASLKVPGATGSSAPSGQTHGGHKLAAGAIAGIVVGAVMFLVICAALFFYVGRWKSLNEVLQRQSATVKKAEPTRPGSDFQSYFPPSPFSPMQRPTSYSVVSQNGQSYAEPQHVGWASPQSGYASMVFDAQGQALQGSPGLPQRETAEMKEQRHELVSPPIQNVEPPLQVFRVELEAPIKAAR
ncbi:hypothetical protein B0J11DRAFT_592558 [Dendryphion nanum]|uniref:Extracellular serine-rich protein n=1 Tax=Dendryphion nanum TaxID=256645 RepID=A0A9P9DF46_9PLEO|nr:hypothetical protein B0J11DRAFT_592558 [Dendryphion nanum]